MCESSMETMPAFSASSVRGLKVFVEARQLFWYNTHARECTIQQEQISIFTKTDLYVHMYVQGYISTRTPACIQKNHGIRSCTTTHIKVTYVHK